MTKLDYLICEASPVTISVILNCLDTQIQVLEMQGDYFEAQVYRDHLDLFLEALREAVELYGH